MTITADELLITEAYTGVPPIEPAAPQRYAAFTASAASRPGIDPGCSEMRAEDG
jgi:hypothetical protein